MEKSRLGLNHDDIRQQANRVQLSYDINYADKYLFVAYNSIDHFSMTSWPWVLLDLLLGHIWLIVT